MILVVIAFMSNIVPPTDRVVCYISGPMTGLPEFNYAAFMDAERRLRAAGYDVRNPGVDAAPDKRGDWENISKAEYERKYKEALRRDTEWLLESHCVALLKGWRCSRGALWEHTIACQLGLYITNVRELESNPIGRKSWKSGAHIIQFLHDRNEGKL